MSTPWSDTNIRVNGQGKFNAELIQCVGVSHDAFDVGYAFLCALLGHISQDGVVHCAYDLEVILGSKLLRNLDCGT